MVPNNTLLSEFLHHLLSVPLPEPTPDLRWVPLNLKITEILSPFNDKNISEL